MSNWTIARAETRDRPTLLQAFHRVAEASYADLAEFHPNARSRCLNDLFDHYYDNRDKSIWVARDPSDNAIGHIWLQPSLHGVTRKSDWIILNLDVDVTHQRQGIGKALLEHAASQARAAGIDRLRLFVAPWNRAALTLYEQLGFKTQTHEMMWTLS